MRSYPRNSPEAANRLVALAMIADGHVCRSELDAVCRRGAEGAPGVPPQELGAALQTLCEDLLLGAPAQASLASCVDDTLIEALVREVDDPALQDRVLEAISAAARADGVVSEGEQTVIDVLRRSWSIAPPRGTLAAAADR
ncbi:MAG: TerB family tellurite resistance protein [Rubrivivax sp.]|nr:TerB family tellurite resistance protein [Rubrivivax sp.]